MIDKELIKQVVFDACSKDPECVSEIISASTEGVKEFAGRQSDKTRMMASMLSCVLDCYPDAKSFGPFIRKDILETIRPWFGETIWFNKELGKLSKITENS